MPRLHRPAPAHVRARARAGADVMQDPFRFDPADAKGPVLRPKDAAALVLVRRKGDDVPRAHGRAQRVVMRSCRGDSCFPAAGSMSPISASPSTPICRPEVRAKVAAGTTTSRARGLALAAVRETFEETGILVGAKAAHGGAHPLGRMAALLLAWRVATTRSAGLRRPRDHAAGPSAPLRRPLLHGRCGRDRGRARPRRTRAASCCKPVWLTLAEARAADVLPITRCVLDEVEARLNGEPRCRPAPFRSSFHGAERL